MSRNAVDEGLTADDDHGPISPEPRAIRRVGMTRCAVGDWPPSRRRKSSSAAAVPIAAGSWAMTVIPGSSISASRMDEPTAALGVRELGMVLDLIRAVRARG